MSSTDPIVTIVIATYDRPDSLRLAIEAARMQHLSRWSMLVIGDCCSPPTAACVDGLADRRIRYVNLPERCYEQSGPNSVGLAVAETPFVALLNHDDLWLRDHLEVALDTLERSGADFFMGRAAFCTETSLVPGRLMFTESSPVDRALSDAFTAPSHTIEPVSAWVLRQPAARRVGPWCSALESWRAPIQDWVMRAWRADLQLVCGREVTVLKPRAATPSDLSYARTSADLRRLLAELEGDLGQLRANIDTEIERCRAAGLSRPFLYPRGSVHDRLLTSENAQTYRETGRDCFDLVLQEQSQGLGDFMRGVVKHRTGEVMKTRPPLDILIQAARNQLCASGAM